ncbi:MAG: c-type cytochrome [Caulobacterales bacterium]
MKRLVMSVAAAAALLAMDVAGEALAQAKPAAAAPVTTGTVKLNIKPATGAAITSGDVAGGAKVFKQCASCHVVAAGQNRVGPSLHKLIGRKSGTAPGFKYSKANMSSGITWTEQELFTYLENPRAKIKGTTMAFVGLKDPKQRADVIAYIQANSK